jgi:bifunctional UDP-N-acetylglucosamine pyrophosphorylase/glucosamine-1-phosphate N-acetyltransferase
VNQIVVVVGHKAEAVKQAIGNDVQYAIQSEQLGTGHAAMQALPFIDKAQMLLLPGDTPLITSETIRNLISAHTESGAAATMLTAIIDEPASYGRIIRGPDGGVERIIEARDATPEVLAIKEVATSIYCFNVPLLKEALSELRTDNAQGEYYLTDTIEILRSKGHFVRAVVAVDARDTLGINTRIELANATEIMRRRILDSLMLDGITIIDPNTTYVDVGVTIGQDSVIQPCTVIEGRSIIGSECIIGPFTRLNDASLGNKVRVVSSTVAQSRIDDDASVGPYEYVCVDRRVCDG